MIEIMRKLQNNSQIKINEKSDRKFVEVLRSLVKLDNLITNKIKIIVCEGEITEEQKEFIVAPTKFIKCHEHSIEINSVGNINKNINENMNIEKGNSVSHNIEDADYPDSSDFDDDE